MTFDHSGIHQFPTPSSIIIIYINSYWIVGDVIIELHSQLPDLTWLAFNRLQLSENAKDLLRGMLERKVSDRLGCGPTGANEMKRTPFFSALDINKVMARGYDPEFRPPASTSQSDVRNFDTEFTNEPAADSLVVSRMTETMQQKSNFEGFTFENDARLK